MNGIADIFNTDIVSIIILLVLIFILIRYGAKK